MKRKDPLVLLGERKERSPSEEV